MGNYVQKENTGTLFPNDYKTQDNHPDYKGEINVNGTLMEIAGWTKQGRNGEFISVSIQPKRERQANRAEDSTRGNSRPQNQGQQRQQQRREPEPQHSPPQPDYGSYDDPPPNDEVPF